MLNMVERPADGYEELDYKIKSESKDKTIFNGIIQPENNNNGIPFG